MATAKHAPSEDRLVRGSFNDGVRCFTVRASSEAAPNSFQVFANGSRSDIVLVISGLGSGELTATWGRQWRTGSDAWREWVETQAFMVFYNGEARVCDG